MTNRVVEELIEIAGISGAIRMCRAFGGRAVYVPPEIHETHPIALVLGFVAAQKLCDRYRGDRLQIPAEFSALTAVRFLEIKNKYNAGWTISELAREYGYTRSGIIKMLNREIHGST